MKKLLLLACILCVVLVSTIRSEGLFKIDLSYGGSFNVINQNDSQGLLDSYIAHLNVPICEDKVCYDVKLVFHWNPIGEFLGFEYSDKDPLTKLDHQPFTAQDYKKLDGILKNKDLNFVKIPIKDLVEPRNDLKVDAYSGATKASIKDEIIEGALFTCYNLWHIAHGAVVDSIQSYTSKVLNKPTVQKLINANKLSYHYFLINTLSVDSLKENLGPLLEITPSTEGYFAKNAMEKFPVTFFELKIMRDFVVNNFSTLDYFTQKIILQKLLQNADVSVLNDFFLDQLEPKNSFHTQYLAQLILNSNNKEVLNRLVIKLVKNKMAISKKNYSSLDVSAKKYGISLKGVLEQK